MTARSFPDGSVWAHTAGFTLIEMLVAMSIMTFLILGLSGGVNFGARAWERGSAHAADAEDMRVIQGVLRNKIEEAYPLLVPTPGQHSHIDFIGTPDSLSFLSSTPQALAKGGFAHFTLLTETTETGLTLVARARHELAVEELRLNGNYVMQNGSFPPMTFRW